MRLKEVIEMLEIEKVTQELYKHYEGVVSWDECATAVRDWLNIRNIVEAITKKDTP